jgi:uncharacterized coiled-coil protein SlyX
MARPKFFGGFPNNRHRKLSLGVSLDNSQFLGPAFKVFVDLVNKHQEQIDGEVLIFVGDEPYAIYVGEEEAKKVADTWTEQALTYLKALQKPYEIVYWNHFTKTEQYQNLANLIRHDYDNNIDGFRDKVIQEAQNFISKKDKPELYTLEKAIDYLLIEAPVYAMIQGKSAYPHQELNDVVKAVVQKYNKDFEYCGYSIGNGKVSPTHSPRSDNEELKKLVEAQQQVMQEQNKMLQEQAQAMNKLQQEMRNIKETLTLMLSLQLNQAYKSIPSTGLSASQIEDDKVNTYNFFNPAI